MTQIAAVELDSAAHRGGDGSMEEQYSVVSSCCCDKILEIFKQFFWSRLVTKTPSVRPVESRSSVTFERWSGSSAASPYAEVAVGQFVNYSTAHVKILTCNKLFNTLLGKKRNGTEEEIGNV